MKTIYEMPMGTDGGVLGAYLGDAKLMVTASYPVAKIMEPMMTPIDKAFKMLEDTIPGDWDNALLEPIKESLKADLLALLSE
jgi:hypothetical protein